MTTKIYHISDTHLGKNQYSSDIRELDYAKAFECTVDDAIEDNADVVLHTGDLFDDRTPSTKSVSYAFKILKKLDDNNIPFLGIVGNHERKWDSQWLDLFQNLDTVHRLGTKPYILNDEVAFYGYDSIRETEWENMDFNVKKTKDDNLVRIVCMHELFVELMSPMKADRKVEEVISRLNIKPDLMPLGDYHASVEKEVSGVPVFYAGSTERTSSTQRDPTYRKIIVEDKKVVKKSWEKVSGNLIPRPFYVVNIDLTDSTGRKYVKQRAMENVPDELIDESVVVINIEGSRSAPINVTEIYQILEEMNVKVQYVYDKRNNSIGDITQEQASNPDSINIEEMIENEIDSNVSNTVKNIDEEIIRDKTVSKSNIRDIVEEQFNVRGDQNEN
jgi:DNA repair exonuclease SbcCD nuclease subunit